LLSQSYFFWAEKRKNSVKNEKNKVPKRHYTIFFRNFAPLFGVTAGSRRVAWPCCVGRKQNLISNKNGFN